MALFSRIMAKGFVNLNPFKYGKGIKQRSKRRIAKQSTSRGEKRDHG
jgi:hypothetical protein